MKIKGKKQKNMLVILCRLCFLILKKN